MRNALKGNLALMAVSAALVANAGNIIIIDRRETTKETTTTYTPVQVQQTVTPVQNTAQTGTTSYQTVQPQVVYQQPAPQTAQQTIIVKEPAPQTIIVEKQVPQTVYVETVRQPHWTDFVPRVYIGCGWYHRPYYHGHWHGPRPMFHYRHHQRRQPLCR